MTPSIKTPASSPGSRRIRAGNLDPSTFAPFGDVIQNPTTHGNTPALESVVANQGTATKWLNVTGMRNWYEGRAGSGKVANCVVNVFVCRPRELGGAGLFGVKVLERHPFTAQTFVPIGLGREDRKTCYLVVVAPTLSSERGIGQTPKSNRSWRELLLGAKNEPATSTATSERRPKGTGPPDLGNIHAFIARGDQAVTYGPGTWHAPMIALGERPIEFVVVQYANGVADEDCQEVEIAEGLIDVELSEDTANGGLKAKL